MRWAKCSNNGSDDKDQRLGIKHGHIQPRAAEPSFTGSPEVAGVVFSGGCWWWLACTEFIMSFQHMHACTASKVS